MKAKWNTWKKLVLIRVLESLKSYRLIKYSYLKIILYDLILEI